jgi:hypothetical protein
MLGALAAIWGSSFMFITIALRDLAPSTLILFRMAFGGPRWRCSCSWPAIASRSCGPTPGRWRCWR